MDTSSPSPYVEFSFDVFNGSVFTVTIDEKIVGYIAFGRNRIGGLGFLKMSQNTAVELKHGAEGQVRIAQELSEKDVALITKTDVTVYSPYFDLENLTITVKGGQDFPQVKPQRLVLPTPIKSPHV